MKNRSISGKVTVCAAITAAALLFTGCTKYKIVAVEDSVADSISTESSSVAAAAAAGSTDLPTSDILDADPFASTETAAKETTAQASTAAASSTAAADDRLQIVILGDSIFDSYRTPSGTASLVAADLGADVYNLAVGGSTAAPKVGDSTDPKTWTEANFAGMANLLAGDTSASILDGHAAADVYGTFDPSKTDYFIVEYGINDFLSSIPKDPDMVSGDTAIYSYRGALETGINCLMNHFPNAKVILMTPGYTQFWNNGNMIGDCNTIDRGYGKLIDYISSGVNLAQTMGIPYINSYEDVDITGYSASDCLIDGIHPTEEGCRRYAAAIEKKIRGLEDEKNGTTATTSTTQN